ncbi:hypothetical protein AAC387_Pa12g1080 [Persea americana]
MAKGSFSSSAPPAAAATALSVDFPVFIDTNLDTHLAMIVTALDTVADFKRKILDEHPRCFPDLGQITIHAMKVWRKSCFYHLSDAMLVRSAFLGSKRAWFVQLDASSTCSTNNGRGPTETFERSENGGQLQKSHLPSLDTGPSNLPDGQAVQTYSPVVKGSPEMNLLLPETNTILVNNFQKVTSCDTIASVPSVPEDSSLPHVGNSTVENPTIVSIHQDGDVSKISTPEANDLNFELGAPLHTVKGSDHKVPEDFDLVNVRNEVSETHNPSKDEVMTDQREYVGNEVLDKQNPSKDDVMTEREDVGNEVLETHNPSKDDVMTNQSEDSFGDKETRVINDQDRSQLTDNYQSKKSTGGLQPEDNSRENIQVETKKRQKRKENDVIVEPVENPSEDVIADADLAEGIKIPQTDGPDKLSSLDASHETQKSIETVPGVIAGSLVGGVDASEMGGSKVESKGDDAAVHAEVSGDKKAKKSGKRKENDVIVEPVENTSEDVIADADLAGGSKTPQTDEPDKLSSLDTSHEAHKSIETVPGVIAGSLVGGVDASEMGASNVEGKGDAATVQAVASGDKKAKKSRKRRAARLNPSVVEEHENVTGDISPSVYESALPGDDLFGIHHHVEIRKGDNDLPMIKELKTMASEAKSCEDGVDSLKLPEATEATEMGDFGGKKGTRPKRSRAPAAKSDASRSRIECVNDTVELVAQKSNLHGLDDKNLNSRQHGIDETKEVENASSQTKLKTSQAESVNENEACPPNLDPMSKTEDTLDFKDEKGKRKSKRIRSNAKSFHDPSMELQDGAHNASGDGENLAIHQTDENKKEAALPTSSENKQEDTALSRKRKKLKSDKTCSKNQLIESMLEEEDNGVKTKSSEPVKTFEPSIELQDGAHNTSGAGENLAIHQTDENKKEEALPANSGNKKKVDTAMSRKSKKLKSDKTSSKSQLAGSMLEGEDNGVKSKSSELVKTPRFETCPNGSPGEANNHDINFKEFFVPGAAKSGDNAKELAATRKPHERTGKRDKKSNAEDPSLHLEKPPSSMDEKDKHVHHHDNGTSLVAGNGKKTQPDHRRDNSFAGPNGIKAMKSKIDDASAAHGSSKVSGKISQKKNIASEAASSVNTDCSEETIYVSKLGKKRPSRSNQYYVAVNKVPDKKPGEVLNNSDREKSSLATLDSIFEHVSGKSSEDEGGKIDSDATADISTDNSSSSAYSDGEDKRRPSNTPALKKRASLESPRTGPSIAHGGKNKENDGNNIAMSQSADTGAKSRSIGMLLRKSSSYRKAKVTASQSRLEDTESQPVDMVPDSQVAHDFPEDRITGFQVTETL